MSKEMKNRIERAKTFNQKLEIDSHKPGRQRLYKAVIANEAGAWDEVLSNRLPYSEMIAWLDGYIAGNRMAKDMLVKRIIEGRKAQK